MASIMLPRRPGVRTAKPRLLDFGAVIRSPLGGSSQRLNRPGNRFGLDVVAPTASAGREGRILISRLMQGIEVGILLPFPQDMPTGAPGAPVVDGAGQAGKTLNLRGFTPSYAAKEGQFFSIIQGGRRYLHFMAAQGIAGTDGKIAASIYPMLRVSPDDGAVCEFARPMIEGFMTGDNLEWQLQTAPYLDVSFTIEEVE